MKVEKYGRATMNLLRMSVFLAGMNLFVPSVSADFTPKQGMLEKWENNTENVRSIVKKLILDIKKEDFNSEYFLQKLSDNKDEFIVSMDILYGNEISIEYGKLLDDLGRAILDNNRAKLKELLRREEELNKKIEIIEGELLEEELKKASFNN